MCTSALNTKTGEEIQSVGDLRRIAPIVFSSGSWTSAEFAALPDEACLCPADVPGTLVFAGFKVWRNPQTLPEFLFEPVGEEA